MPYDNLTTVPALKEWLGQETDVSDGEFGTLIQVASSIIGRYLGRDNLGSVISYTENYFRRGNRLNDRAWFDLTLRHYPIVTVTSVTMNNTILTPISQDELQSGQSGYYVAEGDGEPRNLKFMYLARTNPISVAYTAGYPPNGIPFEIQQACIQFASEIFRSAQWIGMKSRGIAGETTTFDTNSSWGMSNRIRALLQPFRDVNPFRQY